MVRCLNPLQYRPHHTWPGALGITSGLIAGAFFLALMGLLGGCAGGRDETAAIAPTSSTSAESAIAPDAPDARSTIQTLESVSSPADALVNASRLMQAKARRLVAPTDPVAVDLYTVDDRCEGYQSELIQVPRPQSMETTVAWIMAEQTIPELILSGYRTSFDPETKTVTIDLRVARNSRRVLQSLSSCEQKMLLGSLRETLMNQPDWKIESVIFTNRGNPLVL